VRTDLDMATAALIRPGVAALVVTAVAFAAAAYFWPAVRYVLRPRLTTGALAACLLLALVPTASAHDMRLTYDLKSVSARAWKGTVAGDGDLSGTLAMRVGTRRVVGQRWRVRTAWTVEAGERSFTARARGVINFRTRRVVLDGTVVSGFLAGAEMHVRGRVANRKTRRLVGTATLVPSHERSVAGSASAGSAARGECGDPCVSVQVVRHGEGLVTSTFGMVHGSITCGTTCDAVFQSWTDKTIVLTATGESFSHWRDCPAPDGNLCLLDFDAGPACVHAFFTPDESAPASAGSCLSTPPPPPVRPDTRISAGPAARTARRTAAFRFASTEPSSTYRCKLDARAWTSCASPKAYRNLAAGRHVFRVASRDADGNIDPTPAVRSWRIVPRG
jgi:hypothetical protein